MSFAPFFSIANDIGKKIDVTAGVTGIRSQPRLLELRTHDIADINDESQVNDSIRADEFELIVLSRVVPSQIDSVRMRIG